MTAPDFFSYSDLIQSGDYAVEQMIALPLDLVKEVLAATNCPWQAQRLDPSGAIVGDPDAGLRMGAALTALSAALKAVQDDSA